MLREYVPLLMLMGFVVVNGAAFLIISRILSHRRPTKVKGIPYESGMPPLGTARERFSVKFYLVAMLFILFDIEVVFLIPWGAAFRQLGLTGLVAVTLFIIILEVGHVYAWKRGALEWE
jgi:NADH-quinone oxidoreductase subunit A